MTPDELSPFHLTIRPYDAADDPALETWFPEAVSSAFGSLSRIPDSWQDLKESWFHTNPGSQISIFGKYRDESPIGIAVWHHRVTSGKDAIVRLLAMSKPNRGWGMGTAAAYMLESVVDSQRICIPIPANNGLSVYFWLRLGYHPLLAADQEQSMRDEGGMWMVRMIETIPE